MADKYKETHGTSLGLFDRDVTHHVWVRDRETGVTTEGRSQNKEKAISDAYRKQREKG